MTEPPQDIAPAEPDPPSRTCWLHWAATGFSLGCLVGIAVCMAGYVVAHGDRHPERAIEIRQLASRAVVLALPCFAAAGLLLALLLLALQRLLPRTYKVATRFLPLVWVAGLMAYGASWRAAATGSLDGVFLVELVIGTSVLGRLCYAGLWALARGMVRGRVRSLCPGVAFAVGWVLFLFVFGAAAPAEVRLPLEIGAPTADQPNVLLIVLDTVRADHMSCYGYERETTPQIDAFAQDARLYKNVLSPGGWTLPSHASMFTGLPVSAHGCTWAHPYLDMQHETLAELLRSADYQTAGFCSNSIMSPDRMLQQGFNRWWTPKAHNIVGLRLDSPVDKLAERIKPNPVPSLGRVMHERLGAWFETEYDRTRPFFMYLNYIEPHQPYVPPSEELRWTTDKVREKWRYEDQRRLMRRYNLGLSVLSESDIEELETLYDEEIAFVDKMVGDLFGWLRAQGLFDNTLIIITSDHGEHFGEHHLMEHQYSLYEPIVRVPLIVRYPDAIQPGVVDELVQTHDVFPTILEVAGLEWVPLPAQNCRSLLTLGEERTGVAEYLAPWLAGAGTGAQGLPRADLNRFMQKQRAVQKGALKLIGWSEGARELYHLPEDPLEERNLAGELPGEVTRLDGTLETWLGSFEHYVPAAGPPRGARPTSQDDLDALKALGYIQ